MPGKSGGKKKDSGMVLSFNNLQGLTFYPQDEKDMESLQKAVHEMFEVRLEITMRNGHKWLFEHLSEPSVLK